ncbi:Uncharacterised protein (plasmid) [Tsukamurella tyrosinosolvens]|uniref:Uncharacterized protein n=1 Tax=Tsukamurella tyrosinosolvens TaxID=57704 RepID=A0A1H4UCR5_TSUTY|nr:hypothetical protein [Tsukamurella tyrosinosolvens]KXO92959.1 hypothetical protein AXK58_13900 [Tsukamurella tyrosinosolvens]SEC66527.1 hypothetical protein SAMN04489793_2857 [Tsukamurella tyrosinosolvens]VEH94136.1 Uncharacterised protein [Tsukamurella tyrosinosolvens]
MLGFTFYIVLSLVVAVPAAAAWKRLSAHTRALAACSTVLMLTFAVNFFCAALWGEEHSAREFLLAAQFVAAAITVAVAVTGIRKALKR